MNPILSICCERSSPRVMRALAAFGAPLEDIREHDFASPGVVFQIGVSPA